MRLRGTQIIVSPPYGHEQNGAIERAHRIILEKARAMMIAEDIPHELWGEILTAAVDITNMTASRGLSWKTPHEVFYDDVKGTEHSDKDRPNRPNIGHLRVLGCKVIVNIEPEKRVKAQKMEPRGFEGILVGFKGKHLYQVWNPH